MKTHILPVILVLGIWSCQEPDELPLVQEQYDFFQLVEEGLDFAANDLRSKGMYLNDLEAIMQSFDEFLTETIDIGDNNLLISSSTSNSELTPELSQFIERTELDLEDIIVSANSYAEMEQLIYHYVDRTKEGLNSEELSVLILTTHLELIYTRFIIQNADLLEFSNHQGSSHSGIYN